MKIEVGKNYKLKEGKVLAFNGCVDNEIEVSLEDEQGIYVRDIELYDEEKDIGIVNFISVNYSDWVLDLETFKFMFEEVENED